MNPNILITGKHGFIGRAIQGGKAFEGDITDYWCVMDQAENVKGIVHLAAKSNRKVCEDDPHRCIESNLLGLCNVLNVALVKGIWVLFVSTFQIKEKNIYGLTKLVGEELCRVYQKKGVKVSILRLPVVYGPGDRNWKVVTKLITELKLGIEPTIETDEKFYFIYVDDAAKMVENEVEILNGNLGINYTLREITEMIRSCL